MIGLYYPYINIRDDTWLKKALLYWDRIARIVPDGYTTKNSEALIIARGELDAIVDVPPEDAGRHVSIMFRQFIARNAEKLRAKYGVHLIDDWNVVPHTRDHALPGTDPRLANIFREKMGRDLRDILFDEGLALHGENVGNLNDGLWVGVHPEIAAVYMTSLAEKIASQSGFRLLADNSIRHISVGNRDEARYSQLLLGEGLPAHSSAVTPELCANFALQAVIPKDLHKVPIQTIIEIRRKYGGELSKFRSWMEESANRLATEIGTITTPDAIKLHLQDFQKTEVKPRLRAIEKNLKLIHATTVTTAIGVKAAPYIANISIPWGNPYLMTLAGVSLALIPVAVAGQLAAETAVNNNPASFLFHTGERIAPQGLGREIRDGARRYILEA